MLTLSRTGLTAATEPQVVLVTLERLQDVRVCAPLPHRRGRGIVVGADTTAGNLSAAPALTSNFSLCSS